ncbi:uncharacterized protein LOC135823478 [Sycon ciliatum]|uniref:uncharacterized protein LOC135823478 n=1 Tax=Sycon ciliatum TaxID=27933 RepID=UPI0020AB854D
MAGVDDPEELEMHVNNDASLASDQDQQQAEDDDDISMASSISSWGSEWNGEDRKTVAERNNIRLRKTRERLKRIASASIGFLCTMLVFSLFGGLALLILGLEEITPRSSMIIGILLIFILPAAIGVMQCCLCMVTTKRLDLIDTEELHNNCVIEH